MVYNLLKYFQDNLPSYKFSVNGVSHNTSESVVIINETTATPGKWSPMTDSAVQIISRDRDKTISKEVIDDVYDIVNNYYGLLLPENTVNTKVYEAVKTYQMTPIQKPTWLGFDKNGLARYVFNLQIITR